MQPFGASAHYMCKFANSSVIVDTIPSKLSQAFVPVITAKIKVLVNIVAYGSGPAQKVKDLKLGGISKRADL